MWKRTRLIAPLVFGSAVVILVVIAVTTLPRNGSPTAASPTAASPTAASPTATSNPDPSDPAGENGPVACRWSSPKGVNTAALTSKHGQIRNCFELNGVWYVLELGGAGKSGGIDKFACRTPGCSPSSNEFQSSKWHHVTPPYPGGITLLQFNDDGTFIIDDGGHQLIYHPMTNSFSK